MRKWMAELNNHLPINGKQSYIRQNNSFWELMLGDTVLRRATRKNWIISFVRNNWEAIK